MRVALCFSGMVRTLLQTYPSLRQHLIEPYQPDVFVHTYDKMGLRKEKDLPVSETLLKSLLNPTAMKIRSYEEWAVRHRRERDRLYCFPGPIWCPGTNPEWNWKLANVVAMIWHVRECDLLRREHEQQNGFTYDLVIRARMDNIFLQTPAQNGPLADDLVFIPNHSNYTGTCDQFALGNAQAMTKYSDYALHFEATYRSRVLLEYDLGPPEKMLKRYLTRFAQMRIEHIPAAFELQREAEIHFQSHRTDEFVMARVLRGLPY